MHAQEKVYQAVGSRDSFSMEIWKEDSLKLHFCISIPCNPWKGDELGHMIQSLHEIMPMIVQERKFSTKEASIAISRHIYIWQSTYYKYILI
jgi:hypothetical protein